MQWETPKTEKSVNPMQENKPLTEPIIPFIEPMIPIELPTGEDNPFVPIRREKSLELLSWMYEQARPADEGKREVDFGLTVASPQEPITEVTAPTREVSFIPQIKTLPRTASAEAESLNPEPSCVVEEKPTPYSTARKLMKQVPMLAIGVNLYMYNGSYYQRLSPQEAKRLIVDRCRRDVKMAGTPGHPKAVYELLLMEPELAQRGSNVSRWAVSFLNGMLLLDTGEFSPNSPSIITIYGLQCHYLAGDPDTPCFDAFLAQITGGDAELTERIWQMVGYALTPDTNGKAFFLLQGVPNSGKSVLSELLRSFFNEDAVSALDVHALSEKFAVSELQGKALCISPDLPSGPLDNKAVSKLKQLTGNDVVSADIKYKNRVQFFCMAKIILASNHPLLIRERDDAFYERVVVVPFDYTIPKEQQDPYLLKRLKKERDAIATRAIAAYYRLVSRKYKFNGYYEPNAFSTPYSKDIGVGADLTTSVYCFLRSYFVQDVEAGVFMDSAHSRFVERYGFVHLNLFSQRFAELASQLYGAQKTRKRKPGINNPYSYIAGIRFAGEQGR